MSEDENVPGSDRKEQAQPEIPLAPSEGWSADPKLSASLLTIENVKKLQEVYPVAKSSLARQSVEVYLQQSNLLDGENEAGRKEPNLSSEEQLEAVSVGPLREELAENYLEVSEKNSYQDLQARSLMSSFPEAKKCQFADLETQTEWSYSSLGSSRKARKTLDQDHLEEETRSVKSEGGFLMKLGAERRQLIESESLEGSSVEGVVDMVLSSLFTAEDHHDITDRCHLGYCEFCAAALKPFPTAEELENEPEKMGSLPCCRTYREILQCVLQELMEVQSPEGTIDITPHPRLSQALLDSKTKSFLMEELQCRGYENYKEVFEQYMKLGPCVKQVFKISNYPPKPKPVAVKKRPLPKDLLKIDVEFKPKHLKISHPINPVKRYYPDGKIFLLLLPDGTGQVYYPSGNIAILITYLKDVQFSYIVLADSPSNGLVAFFTNQGYAACYYPDRSTRVNLGLCCGSSFDQKGFPQKRWNWWDHSHHVHAPPFQPIMIKLNIYIQVKIEAQDQISLTFTKLHNCIHLNVGARLKLEDPAMLPFLKSTESQKPVVSRSKMVKIQTLFDKLRQELKEVQSIEPPEPSVRLEVLVLIINRIRRWQQRNKMRN